MLRRRGQPAPDPTRVEHTGHQRHGHGHRCHNRIPAESHRHTEHRRPGAEVAGDSRPRHGDAVAPVGLRLVYHPLHAVRQQRSVGVRVDSRMHQPRAVFRSERRQQPFHLHPRHRPHAGGVAGHGSHRRHVAARANRLGEPCGVAFRHDDDQVHIVRGHGVLQRALGIVERDQIATGGKPLAQPLRDAGLTAVAVHHGDRGPIGLVDAGGRRILLRAGHRAGHQDDHHQAQPEQVDEQIGAVPPDDPQCGLKGVHSVASSTSAPQWPGTRCSSPPAARPCGRRAAGCRSTGCRGTAGRPAGRG